MSHQGKQRSKSLYIYPGKPIGKSLENQLLYYEALVGDSKKNAESALPSSESALPSSKYYFRNNTLIYEDFKVIMAVPKEYQYLTRSSSESGPHAGKNLFLCNAAGDPLDIKSAISFETKVKTEDGTSSYDAFFDHAEHSKAFVVNNKEALLREPYPVTIVNQALQIPTNRTLEETFPEREIFRIEPVSTPLYPKNDNPANSPTIKRAALFAGEDTSPIAHLSSDSMIFRLTNSTLDIVYSPLPTDIQLLELYQAKGVKINLREIFNGPDIEKLLIETFDKHPAYLLVEGDRYSIVDAAQLKNHSERAALEITYTEDPQTVQQVLSHVDLIPKNEHESLPPPSDKLYAFKINVSGRHPNTLLSIPTSHYSIPLVQHPASTYLIKLGEPDYSIDIHNVNHEENKTQTLFDKITHSHQSHYFEILRTFAKANIQFNNSVSDSSPLLDVPQDERYYIEHGHDYNRSVVLYRTYTAGLHIEGLNIFHSPSLLHAVHANVNGFAPLALEIAPIARSYTTWIISKSFLEENPASEDGNPDTHTTQKAEEKSNSHPFNSTPDNKAEPKSEKFLPSTTTLIFQSPKTDDDETSPFSSIHSSLRESPDGINRVPMNGCRFTTDNKLICGDDFATRLIIPPEYHFLKVVKNSNDDYRLTFCNATNEEISPKQLKNVLLEPTRLAKLKSLVAADEEHNNPATKNTTGANLNIVNDLLVHPNPPGPLELLEIFKTQTDNQQPAFKIVNDDLAATVLPLNGISSQKRWLNASTEYFYKNQDYYYLVQNGVLIKKIPIVHEAPSNNVVKYAGFIIVDSNGVSLQDSPSSDKNIHTVRTNSDVQLLHREITNIAHGSSSLNTRPIMAEVLLQSNLVNTEGASDLEVILSSPATGFLTLPLEDIKFFPEISTLVYQPKNGSAATILATDTNSLFRSASSAPIKVQRNVRTIDELLALEIPDIEVPTSTPDTIAPTYGSTPSEKPEPKA
ncbi:hypothetical protein, partial [Anaplasma phagocytophilum]|uniref:hypothetical protein n=1 Tax=Anaplasma phagocytophilum TaxID=948 RepID=UPI00201A9F59